jgi:hypothetical protein
MPADFVRINKVSSLYNVNDNTLASDAIDLTAGNLVVVAIRRNKNDAVSITSITDDAGNTYVSAGTQPLGTGSTVALYYVLSAATTKTGAVVTVTFSDVCNYKRIVVSQYGYSGTIKAAAAVTPKETTTNATTWTADASISQKSGDLVIGAIIPSLNKTIAMDVGSDLSTVNFLGVDEYILTADEAVLLSGSFSEAVKYSLLIQAFEADAPAVTYSYTTTDAILDDSGGILANQAVPWSWFPGGSVGALTGITAQDGTAISDAGGLVTASGLSAAGNGLLFIAKQNTSEADDQVFYTVGVAQ